MRRAHARDVNALHPETLSAPIPIAEHVAAAGVPSFEEHPGQGPPYREIPSARARNPGCVEWGPSTCALATQVLQSSYRDDACPPVSALTFPLFHGTGVSSVVFLPLALVSELRGWEGSLPVGPTPGSRKIDQRQILCADTPSKLSLPLHPLEQP